MSAYGAAAVWSMPSSADAHDVRLTRRGRLARTAAVAALLVAMCLWVTQALSAGRALADDTSAPLPVTTQSVVVVQGDSLWRIAERVAPGTDPREVVEGIRSLNGMRSNLIRPGQVLLVPSAA